MNNWKWFIGFCLLSLSAGAQDLTTRDNEEVRLLARRKVERGLYDLLNVLSQEDLNEFERNTLISESFTQGPNQLFYNGDVIVEDDVNPERTSAASVLDLSVEKYLANFDFLYRKSAGSSIQFSNFKVSNLKKGNSLYVKVFYTSLFKEKHKQIATPYVPVRRIAEVRADLVGKKWSLLITRLAFFTPADSVHFTQNDVALRIDASRPLAPDSVQASIPKTDPAQVQEQAAITAYNQLLNEGKAAFETGNLVRALEVFQEADRTKPYEDLTPRIRIYKVQKALEEQTRHSDAELKRRAELARRKRRYEEAAQVYQKLLELKPDSAALESTIRGLLEKARLKAEYNEKFALGKHQELIKDYSRIISAERKLNRRSGDQDNSSDWYLGRGRSYFMLNNLSDALADYTESLRLDFQNLEALEARAALYARQQNYPRAIADLTTYLSIDKTSAEIAARRAAYRIQTNRPAEALADYDLAVSLDNQNYRYFRDRGLFHLRSNAFERALADFNAAILRSRTQPDLFFYRGYAQTGLRQFEPAGQDFSRATELGLSAQLMARIDSIANVYYQTGLQAKVPTEALKLFGVALQLKPVYAAAWSAKGTIHLNRSEDSLAVQSFTKAIQYAGKDAKAWFQRATAWARLKDFAMASADFKQAYTIDPGNYPAMQNEARCRLEMRQFEQAGLVLGTLKAARREIEQRYPKAFLAETYWLAGRCANELGLYKTALPDLSAALDADKNWAPAYTERGRSYEALGRPERAQEDYEKAVALEPTVATHYLALGQVLEERFRYREALVQYGFCLDRSRIATVTRQARIGRSRCFFYLENYPGVIAELNQVVNLKENVDDQARMLYAKVRTGQSEEVLKEIHPDSNSARLLYVLGCANLAANNEAMALTSFKKALQTGLSKEELKKDKLLDFVKKDFRKNPLFTELIDRR
ncbi:tetratricopeptide repeat protein [Larkinella terrae]|uniref:Tetratricopeptide repeat protein n=1 Tax=Larkinella terrae TaxID=2025311 RepID=A0A7K0EER0_9BACT|nr:tetratricopeptide repeat protein [Larkinella terrae]MRS60329.1 tetratricopeptide repeat protein [Larkinella terrae]